MNDAFARAARVDKATLPVYPGDLVVREDKAVIADAIRRFAGGAARASDLAVRLKDDPDDPVVLSIACARAPGQAAGLLSPTDNSEEDRKSAVEGKSGQLRVNLGGSGNIQTKNKE